MNQTTPAGAAASGEPAGAPGPARGASPRMRARVCPLAGGFAGGRDAGLSAASASEQRAAATFSCCTRFGAV